MRFDDAALNTGDQAGNQSYHQDALRWAAR